MIFMIIRLQNGHVLRDKWFIFVIRLSTRNFSLRSAIGVRNVWDFQGGTLIYRQIQRTIIEQSAHKANSCINAIVYAVYNCVVVNMGIAEKRL